MSQPPIRKRNPAARAFFAANKSLIEGKLNSNLLMSEIYEALSFPGSYSQFTRYCRKAFNTPRDDVPAPPPAPSPRAGIAPSLEAAPPVQSEPRRPTPKTRTAPNWDPANIDRARLIGRTEQ